MGEDIEVREPLCRRFGEEFEAVGIIYNCILLSRHIPYLVGDECGTYYRLWWRGRRNCGVRSAECGVSQAGWFVRGSRWDGSLRESLEACGRSRRCGVRFEASCRPRLRATWATPSAVKCGTRGWSSGTPTRARTRVRMVIWHSEPEVCDLRLRYGTRPGCCHGIR